MGPVGSVFAALCRLGVAPVVGALGVAGLGFLLRDWILIPLLALFLGATLWPLDETVHGTGAGIGKNPPGKPALPAGSRPRGAVRPSTLV